MKFLRYLVLLVLLLFVSCPKQGSDFPWKLQPNQDTIPLAVGRWLDPNVMFIVDPNVYPASDYIGVVPDYIKVCVEDTRKTLPEFVSTCKSFGLNYTEVPINTPSKISIKFYYGPYRGTSSLFDIQSFTDLLVVSEKGTSATWGAPAGFSNYNGVAYMNANKKHYESGTIWVNVYAYQFFYVNGNSTWRYQAYQYQDRTFWHEMFHTVGLGDDPMGTIPGLMVYRSLINRPNNKELEVCKWLNGGK